MGPTAARAEDAVPSGPVIEIGENTTLPSEAEAVTPARLPTARLPSKRIAAPDDEAAPLPPVIVIAPNDGPCRVPSKVIVSADHCIPPTAPPAPERPVPRATTPAPAEKATSELTVPALRLSKGPDGEAVVAESI